jgi:hypothetical protein
MSPKSIGRRVAAYMRQNPHDSPPECPECFRLHHCYKKKSGCGGVYTNLHLPPQHNYESTWLGTTFFFVFKVLVGERCSGGSGGRGGGAALISPICLCLGWFVVRSLWVWIRKKSKTSWVLNCFVWRRKMRLRGGLVCQTWTSRILRALNSLKSVHCQ